ncbi:MAG: spore coat U domain-containing protein [Gammaproteobacteria bacterium]|nr:spore coat U domain-containing protein [Gammaproteobacteria bacterium]
MTSIKKASSRTLAFAIVACLAGASFAVQANDTGTLLVSAQVAPVCQIVTTAPVAFGTLDPTIDNDTAGSITWQCTTGTNTEITLDGGLLGSADGATRLMGDGGSNTLPYQLYTDTGRSNPWLNTAGGGVPVLGVGYLGGDTISVYGRVTQAVAAAAINAAYNDSVTVTITF